MKIQLMQVGERLSLGTDPEGYKAVRNYIERAYPEMTTKTAGTYTRGRFGGAEFLHENEWDDPCLLSQTLAGDELLKGIAAQLS